MDGPLEHLNDDAVVEIGFKVLLIVTIIDHERVLPSGFS
jgi:hypothetical protein